MEIDFEKLGGLVPAIIQDAVTKNVLWLFQRFIVILHYS